MKLALAGYLALSPGSATLKEFTRHSHLFKLGLQP